ncbi:IS4 family transposase [Ammoniphilus sp. CFH 90114]|uniref:IS4 family transposase n=1 Tax=Ammoniphilus sp. CFH 90114 TaxID=2493665 RepID=UPI00100E3244|nr:IS4 family transposase [Ammoniphilus sp. CFH 90114]RXS99759.1 IS4 family transposase [Ammoniphilus sp. CFH 90114]
MKTRKTFLEGIRITEQLLHDVVFMCESRLKPTYFTREGNNKMTFVTLMLFALNFVRKSIQLELDAFSALLNPGEMGITKQGYSEARKKISPTAFIKLADVIMEWFYRDEDFKTFNGYRLCAVDASILELNNSDRLRNAFGFAQGKTVKLARAMASGIYDLENDMMIVSQITHFTSSEREVAVGMIEKLKKMGLKNDLLLFDRGYPSREFITYLEDSSIKYVIRVSKSTMREVKKANDSDQIVEMKVKGRVIKVRVLRFLLESGVEEVLLTNLWDDSLGVKQFKELYFRRWGIESKYNELKNRLQIQNFTGDTVLSVEQDFYASIYLSNMVALIKLEANEEIAQEQEGKNLKHTYQVNTNMVIGRLKNSLISLILEVDPVKRFMMFKRMMQEMLRNKVPVRPERSYIRKMSLKANKHPMNLKRCL